MGRVLRAPGGPSADIDRAEALRALRLIVDPAEGFQVACHGEKFHRFERFGGGDLEAAVAWADAAGAGASAVQVALQPIGPSLSRNVHVGDALRWRWLLIDIDPLRPPAAMAADGEREVAVEASYRVMDELAVRGWPEPVLLDTGNGVHLLYRVDEPNEEPWRGRESRMKRIVNALGAMYGGPGSGVTFDAGPANPAGHTRLPGSWNRKGPDAPGRPHRRVRIVSAPAGPDPVPTTLLLELAGPDPVPPALPPSGLRAWASSGAREARWAEAALSREAAKVRASASVSAGGEGRNNRLYRSAFALGGFVPALLVDAQIEAALLPEAVAVGLDERAARATIASGLRGGRERPRVVPEPQPQPPGLNGHAKPAPSQPASGEQPRLITWRLTADGELLGEGGEGDMPELGSICGVRHYGIETLSRVMQASYPEPRWAVHGLLSEGLNILAGAPKQGKSMLSLNLALTVAGGGKALSDRKVTQGDVLYLSLEDKMRRIRDRARLMLTGLSGTTRDDAIGRLQVVTAWERLDRGGLMQLDLWVRSRKQPGLIIVDVWNRFAPKARHAVNAYSQDADAMALLKALADHHGVPILVVHHTRKLPNGGEVDDFISEISGTLGLAGTADGIMALIRTRGESQATLHFTGRDQGEGQLVVEFDRESLTWKSLGTAKEYATGPLQRKVLDHLRACGADGATCPEVASAIGQKPDAIRPVLHKLKTAGAVAQRGNTWALAGPRLHDPDGETY